MTDDFRAMIEQSPDGVAVVRDGCYVYANAAWRGLIGRSEDDLIGVAITDDVVERDVVRLSRALEDNNVAGGFGFRSATLTLRTLPVAEFEGQHCVALVATDTTEQRKLQARLLLMDRLMSVGALASGVAHEINNPLSYVMGNLAFMSEELARVADQIGEPARSDLLEAVAEGQEGAERVRSIVRNLQAFARADQEGRKLIDVNRTIEAALGMAFVEIRHRAHLVKRLGEDLPPVLSSEARLGQVVLNLLLNAAHALPEGEAQQNRITIITELDRASRRVRLEIADTGPGIPPEILDRVFDPFFTTKPMGVGTGLGLSIVHSIVTAMGGQIEVYSKQGVGTRFSVWLPTAAEGEARPRAQADPASVPRGRVLVIDDEPLVASAVGRALKHHDVTIVRSGRRAIELFDRGEKYDLVFCDLMMPDLTGMDVYKWIQGHKPGIEDNIVFMTGGIFTERARSFLKGTKNHQLSKPFDLDRLRRYVDLRLSASDIQTGDLP